MSPCVTCTGAHGHAPAGALADDVHVRRLPAAHSSVREKSACTKEVSCKHTVLQCCNLAT